MALLLAGTVYAGALPVDEGAPSLPISINENPSEGAVEITEGAFQVFSITGDRAFEAEWFIDRVSMKTEENVQSSSYIFEGDEPGTYNITAVATTPDRIIQKDWALLVRPEYYSTGCRIWDENAGLPTTYMWNALSFSGFYYDPDSGTYSEELVIRDIDRNIEEGDLIYTAKPVESDFEYSEWGSYQVIGFLGEKYFAGYTKDASVPVDEDISLISQGVLSKVLIDDEATQAVRAGSSIALYEGYTLNIVEIGTNGSQVWIRIKKNGSIVGEGFLSSNGDFVYEKDLDSAKKVPIIIVRMGPIFTGDTTGTAFIKGIFQVSDNYTEVNTGNSFGEMGVKYVSSTEIKMENKDDIFLDGGDTIALMGNIMIQVADDEILSFAPVMDMSEAGIYELRGTIFDNESSFIWNPFYFEAFYYNLDKGIGNEQLAIESLDERLIPENKLVYTSSIQPVEFEYEEWGNYPVIGLFGEKFIPLLRKGEDIQLARADRLSKLLIDEAEIHTLRAGETLNLGEGYALTAKQVDVDGGKAWLEFTKDGESVDYEIINIPENKDVATQTWVVDVDNVEDQEDIIVFRVYVDDVFQSAVDSIVQIKGLWLIDYENAFTIEKDDGFGKLDVTCIGKGTAGTNPSFGWLELRNDNSIFLGRDSVKSICGVMKFMVADSDSLSFYPFVIATVNPPGSVDPPNLPPSTYHNTYTISLQKGWNLVSTPLILENSDVGSIFGNKGNIILPVYTWNPVTRQYYTVDNLEIGKGYWVLALDDTKVTFTGTSYKG